MAPFCLISPPPFETPRNATANADTAGAGAIITLDPDVIEPPAKHRATEANDDFNVLFGCSDNTEQEAVHALDDDIDDEMQRYLKEVELKMIL